MRHTNRSAKKTTYRTNGSVALAPMPKYAPVLDSTDRKNASQKKLKKVKHMSPGYVIFLMLALAALSTVCSLYIQLQSEVTILGRSNSKLESQLMDLTLSNDEEYARIMGAVDIEEIKRIAMDELGMAYPDKSQVVEFTNSDSDYVRQFSSIPD